MSQSTFSHSNQADQHALAPPTRSRPIWPWLFLLGAVALVLVLRWTVLPEAAGGRDGQDDSAVGNKLAKLDLQPLTGNGQPISLADLEGKVTLINFWGPWCGVCAVEFPHLVELEQHFRKDERFQLLSISTNYDPRDDEGLADDTAEFLKQMRADFPTYRDPNAATISALIESGPFKRFGFPTTLVVGQDAVIRGVWIGYRPGDERGVREAIERLLRGDRATGEPGPPEPASGG